VIPTCSKLFYTEYHHLPHKQYWHVSFRLSSLLAYTISPLGSDILAHTSASDSSGAVTPNARAEVLERVKEEFPPELLNRLDSMLVFNRLTHESIMRVVDLRLEDIAARLVQ
jgi:ATP-dependent Clp protease ATP-binding subunit ClpA